MLVYRLEKDGHGPYSERPLTGPSVTTTMGWAHYNVENAPSPIVDMPDFIYMPDRDQFVFGCPSREALHTWFGGWEFLLKRDGFIVCVYEVGDNFVIPSDSGRQVAFMLCRAELVDIVY